MSDKISINIALYKENMSNLRSHVEGVEATMTTSESFDKTTVTPFTNDLANTIRALELLDEYKQLCSDDITIFEKTGDRIREQDEQLSKVVTPDPLGGHQPMPI